MVLQINICYSEIELQYVSWQEDIRLHKIDGRVSCLDKIYSSRAEVLRYGLMSRVRYSLQLTKTQRDLNMIWTFWQSVGGKIQFELI